MTIACVRCGASEEGEIITAPIAFTFKHEKGCGHGLSPLCVIKGKTPKKVESKKTKKKAKEEPAPWINDDTPSESSLTVEATSSTFSGTNEA